MPVTQEDVRVNALKETVRRLYRERQILIAGTNALFDRLRQERANQQRLYDLGYKHGSRNRPRESK